MKRTTVPSIEELRRELENLKFSRNTHANPILLSDSYKSSHWLQYPPGAEGYFGYIEARKPVRTIEPFTETVFFGLQIFVKDYLLNPITEENIDEAENFFALHGEPFNRKGWEHILNKYNGYLPVTIKAVKEGTVIPEGNILLSVECDDPDAFWVGSFLETSLLRAVWYPSTVATNSRECKKLIYKYMLLTSDDPVNGMMFKLHDFGARGVSSSESAKLGGAAHLINFMGSDTIEGVKCANDYYNNGKMTGFSIPATEHSTITAWGKDHEVDAYRNMLKQFGKPGAMFACVSDSYNIFNACEHIWGEELKDEIVKSGAIVIVRPDSGDPASTVTKCLHLLDDKFGSVVNSKGFKVLNNVRVIQGDGINLFSIKDICKMVTEHKFSLDNVNFGMGGALLQYPNRDTLRFAMKCSSIKINCKWTDVFKSPIGDPGKASKAGRISLYRKRDGHGAKSEYATLKINPLIPDNYEDMLEVVYTNGRLIREQTFDEVRKLASL